MEKCRTCTNRYACEGQFEFECKERGGAHYHGNLDSRRVSLSDKESPQPTKRKVPQVKIVTNGFSIEERINEWFRENDNIELIDIKYQVTDRYNCAMIIYNTYI